jgi:hypothetical protein
MAAPSVRLSITIDNPTEDAEMEKLYLAHLTRTGGRGSWGTEVWMRVGKRHENADQSQDEPVARPTTQGFNSSPQRQLRHLQDLRDGSGLGLTVKLSFLTLLQLLSPSSPLDRNLISILDIAMSRPKEFDVHYSAYIVDEFLLLLGNIFKGQTGPHIDRVRQ